MPAKRITGHEERVTAGGETVAAFVPLPLPPRDPDLVIEGPLAARLALAQQAVAGLDLAGGLVPNLDWFLYSFVRKEAVLSAQIEGTQATLVDLLHFEAAGGAAPGADLEQVCNALDALAYARGQLADPQGLPLSMRLLNQTHKRLMRGVRGANRLPGEVRRSQNWIGGSRPGNAAFVPPPPHRLAMLLSAFEAAIHRDEPLPGLVRAGLLHVQFETIHPYLDGNGRIGRLLVLLLLEHWRLLSSPLLFLSLFFKRHQAEYYRRLDAVRRDGDWEGWLDFFLDGVATVAIEAMDLARALAVLVEADRRRLLASHKTSVAALRLFEVLPRQPIITVASAGRLIQVTKPTAIRAVAALVEAGILAETSGRRRDRVFAYQAYLDRLRTGTDLDRPA